VPGKKKTGSGEGAEEMGVLPDLGPQNHKKGSNGHHGSDGVNRVLLLGSDGDTLGFLVGKNTDPLVNHHFRSRIFDCHLWFGTTFRRAKMGLGDVFLINQRLTTPPLSTTYRCQCVFFLFKPPFTGDLRLPAFPYEKAMKNPECSCRKTSRC